MKRDVLYSTWSPTSLSSPVPHIWVWLSHISWRYCMKYERCIVQYLEPGPFLLSSPLQLGLVVTHILESPLPLLSCPFHLDLVVTHILWVLYEKKKCIEQYLDPDLPLLCCLLHQGLVVTHILGVLYEMNRCFV